MTILFVCSGNTCRSPLAVAAWKLGDSDAALDAPGCGNRDETEVQVLSAGIMAGDGAPASKHTRAVAAEWGVDIDDHRSQRLTDDLVRQADLICTMTQGQANSVRLFFPDSAYKVRALGEFLKDQSAATSTVNALPASQVVDIADPFGRSVDAYRTCGEQIRRSVKGLRGHLSSTRDAS